jgi:hypothetical protein
MGKKQCMIEFLLEYATGQNHFGDLGVDRMIILKWILQNLPKDYHLVEAHVAGGEACEL